MRQQLARALSAVIQVGHCSDTCECSPRKIEPYFDRIPVIEVVGLDCELHGRRPEQHPAATTPHRSPLSLCGSQSGVERKPNVLVSNTTGDVRPLFATPLAANSYWREGETIWGAA